MAKRTRKRSPIPDFQRLEEDDVAAYLLNVKLAFKNEEQKLIQVGALLQQYKAQNISADDLLKEGKTVFKDHPDLFLALNVFIAEPHRVAVEFQLQPLEQECLDFINRLKDRCPTLQGEFFSIMKRFGKGDLTPHGLIRKVKALISREDDLLKEFIEFIPRNENLERGGNEDYLPIVAHKFALEGPRKLLTVTNDNFPDLVYKQQILFFQKAKVKLRKKAAFDTLVRWFEKYLGSKISSAELEKNVAAMYPDFKRDEWKSLFIHENPSYVMLCEKQKLTEAEERPTQELRGEARAVLNDDYRLVKYPNLSDCLSLVKKQKSTSKQSDAQNIKNQNDDILQDKYLADKHRFDRILEEIGNLEKILHDKCKDLLKGVHGTTLEKYCDERHIQMLRQRDVTVLPIIRHIMERRRDALQDQLERLEEAKQAHIDTQMWGEAPSNKIRKC